MKYIVTVDFIVQAEDIEPWTAEQCVYDFVRHRIDEGYRLDERIRKLGIYFS